MHLKRELKRYSKRVKGFVWQDYDFTSGLICLDFDIALGDGGYKVGYNFIIPFGKLAFGAIAT